MKCSLQGAVVDEFAGSRPAWGAWIEMLIRCVLLLHRASRPAWGAWIEINRPLMMPRISLCRAPHGARGLKYFHKDLMILVTVVAPRMGRVD